MDYVNLFLLLCPKFRHKYAKNTFMMPRMAGIDAPKLVKAEVVMKPLGKVKWSADAELKLGSTDYDPLADVPVKKPVMGFYGKFDIDLLPGKVVGEVGESEFLPYAFSKVDTVPVQTSRNDNHS
jgi:hypothetical protein